MLMYLTVLTRTFITFESHKFEKHVLLEYKNETGYHSGGVALSVNNYLYIENKDSIKKTNGARGFFFFLLVVCKQICYEYSDIL